MKIKQEVHLDTNQSDFTSKILGLGYFPYVRQNQESLIFKRRVTVNSNIFEIIYRRLNPLNLLYIQIQPKSVVVIIKIDKVLFFLLSLNLFFLFLLFMAGMPTVGTILLPSIFLVLQTLMVFFYSHLEMTEIINIIN